MLPDDLEIAPGYTTKSWKALSLDPGQPNSKDWERALRIFNARIRCRFLDPVDVLIKHEKGRSRGTFGFVIVIIDCAVMETLQGFREGQIDHRRKSKRLFINFLKRWPAFGSCVPDQREMEERAELIYRGYRCALHHSGATEGAFRIGISGPTFAFENSGDVKINRICLHDDLKHEFDDYCASLRNPKEYDLRFNFKKKMDALCGLFAGREEFRDQ
jgi:hypothetical protein